MINKILTRVRIVYTILLFTAVCIIIQIVRLQFFSDYPKQSEKLAYTYEVVEANRGNILACDDRFLATSVPYFQLRIDCKVSDDATFLENIDGLSSALSKFFKDKSAAAYKQELLSARAANNRYKALGNRDVDFTELEQIKQFPLFKLGPYRGGIIAVQKNKRKNPYGRLGFRTIGFINNEGLGAGVESAYDFWLKGHPGEQIIQRLPGGERMPLSSVPSIRPVDGYDVKTTIDIDIQEATESALRSQLSKPNSEFEAATAIVMEVKTGAIRAISNMKRNDDGSYDESYNYAIGAATEPGSTFKLATLIALLEGDYISLNSKVDAGNGTWNYAGKTFNDVGSGLGNISVLKAFEKSSNVSFAQLAVKHFAGREREYVDRLYNMKLRENLNIELLGEGKAMIRYPTDKMWSKLSLPMMSIGYEVLLTPMHILTFYNAIANGGKMMKPYFIESLKRYGQVEKEFRPQVISGAICSKPTIDSVQKALRYVVIEGTAKAINDARYEISGKTGTAQIAFDGKYVDNGFKKHQASFAGFFPSNNPRYTMVVVLYSHKTQGNFYGGTWAAPVFKQIADKIYGASNDWYDPIIRDKNSGNIRPPLLAGNDYYARDILNILSGNKPSYAPASLSNWISNLPEEASVPDVTGMGLRDAIYLLERKGLKVTITGMGEVVAQYPAPGTPLQEVKSVEVTLQKTTTKRNQLAQR